MLRCDRLYKRGHVHIHKNGLSDRTDKKFLHTIGFFPTSSWHCMYRESYPRVLPYSVCRTYGTGGVSSQGGPYAFMIRHTLHYTCPNATPVQYGGTVRLRWGQKMWLGCMGQKVWVLVGWGWGWGRGCYICAIGVPKLSEILIVLFMGSVQLALQYLKRQGSLLEGYAPCSTTKLHSEPRKPSWLLPGHC